MTIETEREADGRFITEIPELPGDMVYGTTEAEACARRSRWRGVSLPTASRMANRCRRYFINETAGRIAPLMLAVR